MLLKKVLYIAVILLVCTLLTGFRGEAIIFIEGKVVDSNTKMGVGDVQVTFWDLIDNRRYDVKTDSKGIWKWSLTIDGGKFEDRYYYSSTPTWKIEYRKEGFTFSNASMSRTTLRESHYMSYLPPTFTRVYDITAYVEATQIFNPNPISSSATITSGPAITLMISGYNKVPLEMRFIPAGTFVMGSSPNEKDRDFNESPQQQVTISQPFYLGVYEVTQEQWAAVMGTYPSRFGYVPTNPVEQISWEDCQSFINKLNTMGLGTFRLPTEAEWEYACRAGSTTRFPWGDDPGYSILNQYAWYGESSTTGATHYVGQKRPNSWGLYDMHGNVWEWCNDWFADTYQTSYIDPKGPATGMFRILRGGSWKYKAKDCRSARRGSSYPTSVDSETGFRLVRMF